MIFSCDVPGFTITVYLISVIITRNTPSKALPQLATPKSENTSRLWNREQAFRVIELE